MHPRTSAIRFTQIDESQRFSFLALAIFSVAIIDCLLQYDDFLVRSPLNGQRQPGSR